MTRVYLAGPISGLTYTQATEWREWAKTMLAEYGMEGLSPFDQHNAPVDKDQPLDAWFEEQIGMDTLSVVQGDLNMVDKSTVLLMNLSDANRASLGSMAELGYAYAKGKYIVTVSDEVHHNHPFVTHLSHTIVPTLPHAFRALQRLSDTFVAPPYA
jgi:nucleoside 2-deoxyribosyltransferase